MATLTFDLILALCVGFVVLAAPAFSWELNILHTNDFHARVQEVNKYSGTCSESDAAAGKCFGGSARIKTMADQKRAEYTNTILLSAGDQFQGTMWFYHYGGSVLAEMMNLIGYDVMAVGNHDFDHGVKGLREFVDLTNFPVLGCNLNLSNTPSLQGVVKKVEVMEVGGEKLGIVGYVTTNTAYLSRPETVTFEDELTSIQAEVDKLSAQGVNKIIALGHAGFHKDKILAKELRDVDVIVGGHTNTFLYTGEAPSSEVPEAAYPYVSENVHHPQGVLVVQDYAFGKYLGDLHVTFDDQGKVTSYSGNPILLDSSVVKDEEVMQHVEAKLPAIEAVSNQVIGQSHVVMQNRATCRREECNLGNMVTDGMIRQNLEYADGVAWADVSIAMINSGGMRASLEKGPLTVGMVRNVHPFGNTLDIIEIKGSVIREIMEHSASGLEHESGRFMQFAGLQVTYDRKKPAYSRVVEVKATCTNCSVPKLEPLQDEKVYKVIIIQYLVDGGDGYDMIEPNLIARHRLGDLMEQSTIDYITQTSPIYTGLYGRIRFVDELVQNNFTVSICQNLTATGSISGGNQGTALTASVAGLLLAILLHALKICI